MDRWRSQVVVCEGGIDLSSDKLTQGATRPGSATILQNFEPALEGGYRRINGYVKYDSNAVTGDTNAPILGVGVGLGGVFAARLTSTDNAIYYSTGSGWSSAINSSARTGSVNKIRFEFYSITEPVVIITDGVNPAAKYNGTTYTLLNGTGAPSNPKYAVEHYARLVLSGYGNGSKITLSAPNDDTVFAGSGAIELNVGDTVVGLKQFRQVLYIFCENSIKRLVGNSSSNFEVQSVTDSIGCVSGDSIQEVGGDVLFLAPDGIRSLAATDKYGDIDLPLVSKSIQPLVRDILGLYNPQDYSSLVIRSKSQYRLFIQQSGVVDSNAAGFLGKLEYGQGGLGYAWATLKGINVYSAHSAYNNDTELSVFGHPTDGYVYKLETGNDFDGQSIAYVYETPDLTFQDATLRKVMQKITIYMQVEGDIDINLDLEFDDGDQSIIQPDQIMLMGTFNLAKYGTAKYGTAKYSSVINPIIKQNLTGSGHLISFRFANNDMNAPFRIDSFQIEYSQKGRR